MGRFHWWRRLTAKIDLFVVAIALIILGIGLLVPPSVLPGVVGASVLQVIGGGVLGAGLTALVSTVTSREAIHQQYTKDANLRRKEKSYGPLYTELKAVREHLEDADRGKLPYPMQVNIEADQIGERGPWRDVVPFQEWALILADHRIEDFTETAQAKLNAIHERALTYNAAYDAAEDPTSRILGRHAELAVKVLRHSADYERWLKRRNEQAQHPLPLGHEPSSERDWYEGIETLVPLAAAQSTTCGQLLANQWLVQFPSQRPARTRGWLVAHHPEMAATHVHNSYQPGLYPAPPLEWIEGIFEAAWPDLRNLPTYHAAQAAFADLLYSVRAAQALLEDGLRRIRDRYEGGTPIV